jgi:2-keto-4-pentenoate hydratase
VEDTLARDIFQRHVILGANDASRAGCNLGGLMGHIWKNDVEVAPRSQPAATSENLVDIVRDIANTLAASEEKLAAGHAIITGSIVPPLPMQAGDRLVFQLDPIDTISV